MIIRYLYTHDTYYINYNDIVNIFKNSEFSDIKKYDILKLLTRYILYDKCLSFALLTKIIKKYDIEFVKNIHKIKFNTYLYPDYYRENIIFCNFYNLFYLIYKDNNINMINKYIYFVNKNCTYKYVISNIIIDNLIKTIYKDAVSQKTSDYSIVRKKT